MAKREIKTVLFLCTGNYYRSRFAEILFNSVAGRMGLPWRATSRALALERGADNVGPLAKSAAAALNALGIRSDGDFVRLPLAVAAADFESANRIVALKEAEHRPMLLERHSDWAERVEYWKIDDVPGILPEIEKEVAGLVARLLGGGLREEPVAEVGESPAVPVKKVITLKVGRETKGRRGKGVTTVFEIPLTEDEIAGMATLLKQKCGTGGTVKDGRIEIQGDQRERIVSELERMGYKVKRVGG